MRHRALRLIPSLVFRLGGVGSGAALYLIGDWVMSIRVSIGIPPTWLWGTTVVFIVAYLVAGRLDSARWRGWARTAGLTGALLWSLAWFGGWTGHGGSGYFESSRMVGHLYNVADAAETPSDIEGVMTGLESYQEITKGYFGEPELTQAAGGWSVVLVSPHSGRVCAVFRGSVSAWPATREGRPTCRLPPPWLRLGLFSALLVATTAASITAWRDPTAMA